MQPYNASSMPISSIDSSRPRPGSLSDVPEERPPSKTSSITTSSSGSTSRGSPFPSNSRSHTPTLSTAQAHPAFRTQLSSSSLASVASASGVPVGSGAGSGAGVSAGGVQQQNTARPALAKNPSSLRVASTASLRSERDKDRSDTASATGVSVVGVMAASTPTPHSGGSKGRSKSPGSATIRERDRDREKDKDKDGASHPLAASKSSRALVGQQNVPKYRYNPHLPVGNAEPVPATLMYWSKAPVYGLLPTHGLRAHSVTLVDGVAWIFGGCDEKGCWKDVLCFNTDTMQWSNPTTLGDLPPPCRAHTATLVDRRIVMFGGGEGPVYYNEVYVLDTVTRQWFHPQFGSSTPTPEGSPDQVEQPPKIPPPRRAHTAVLYRGKIWVFGGGNGTQALNDLWTLEVGHSAPIEKMRWELMKTEGKMPSPRGYHTANLVGNVMVVMGGSDGRECFSDIWCLNLDTLQWSQVKLQTSFRRLSHTATQVGSYLFIWGGHNGSSYTSDLLLFNLVALIFEPRAPAGRPPSARGYHAALLTDSRLYVFGGFNGNDVYDDVHVLDLAGAAYLPQVTSFRIECE